jgi:hypothetical protein
MGMVLSVAVGPGHGHRSGTPERALAGNLHLVQAEAAVDFRPLKGDGWDGALDLRQRPLRGGAQTALGR